MGLNLLLFDSGASVPSTSLCSKHKAKGRHYQIQYVIKVITQKGMAYPELILKLLCPINDINNNPSESRSSIVFLCNETSLHKQLFSLLTVRTGQL